MSATMTDAKTAHVSKTTSGKAAHRKLKKSKKRSAHYALAAMPCGTRAAFERILGVDLATVEERWLDTVSMLDVMLAEYTQECFTRPDWKVIARGWPDERRGFQWVVDVEGFHGGPVRGLGPRSASGLAGALLAASGIVQDRKSVV